MGKLCFLFGDQLSDSIASLSAIDKTQDQVVLAELMEEASYVKHHPKKIAFLFAAMRHFAEHLRTQGYKVQYIKLTDPGNTGIFEQEILRLLNLEPIEEIHITEPGEWRVLEKIQQLQARLNMPLILHEDNRFLCPIRAFKGWAAGKKQLRMEYFYRGMRKRYQILLDEQANPIGGSWNYDIENRKNANQVQHFLKRATREPDQITHEVLALVEQQFAANFGDLYPFDFAINRDQAVDEARAFMTEGLARFGDYQDAMRTGESYLFHSRLSFYLNAGLLLPLELCQMAEAAFHSNLAPLAAVEGFIRQILGWREYVRGIYWLNMPEYAERNYFNAQRPLPALYWGEKTGMHCLQEVVRQTKKEAYSHHIQRLMITGNFALLTGLAPQAVCEWYLAVYADAYEWVELPNTLGMALYADGGLMASKPYAASGNYIHKMSDFCKSCQYKPKELLGEQACPFNSLYWNFMASHEDKLKDNPRLHFVYLNWNKMGAAKQQAIRAKAREILNHLDSGQL